MSPDPLDIVIATGPLLEDWRTIHNAIIPSDPLSADDVVARSTRHRLTLAYDDGRLVGNATVRPPREPDAVATVIVRILPEHRRNGHGTAYLHAELAQAQALGARRIETVVLASNTDGLAFAQAHGFIEHDRYAMDGDTTAFIDLHLPDAQHPSGDEPHVLLRYRYHDDTMQAALPMRVVQDGDTLVAWLSSGTQIMYWSLANGEDPRSVPLAERFTQVLTTAPRQWQGNGVLRVMPGDEPFQVLHFWDDDGAFVGWYVNFEAPRRRRGDRVDSIDWHLDLWIDPDGTPTWKDEDEAEAAVSAGHLDQADLATARATGLAIIDDLPGWLHAVGDWRGYEPPLAWEQPLGLPGDWDA